MTGPPPDSWAVDPTAAGAREVVPGLWRLRIPLAWEQIDHVNAYAIERDDGVLLVDCGGAGHPTCVAALQVALEQAGCDLGDVSVLALTHAHTDHAGLAALFAARERVTIWGHHDDAHLYAPRRDPKAMRTRRATMTLREGVPPGRLEPFADVREEVEGVLDTVHPDRFLRDGITIDSRLGPWEVLETPGHAPSHVCLVQRDRRLAIVGDLICAAFVPWLEYGWTPDPAAEILASFDRLDSLGPLDLALPGHGRPLTEPAAVTAAHREGIERRIAATAAALRQGSATAYQLADLTLGADSADDLDAVGHVCETLAYLRYLRRRDEATREVDANGVRRYRASERAGAPIGTVG